MYRHVRIPFTQSAKEAKQIRPHTEKARYMPACATLLTPTLPQHSPATVAFQLELPHVPLQSNAVVHAAPMMLDWSLTRLSQMLTRKSASPAAISRCRYAMLPRMENTCVCALPCLPRQCSASSPQRAGHELQYCCAILMCTAQSMLCKAAWVHSSAPAAPLSRRAHSMWCT